jgi:hypothetical protein
VWSLILYLLYGVRGEMALMACLRVWIWLIIEKGLANEWRVLCSVGAFHCGGGERSSSWTIVTGAVLYTRIRFGVDLEANRS